MKQLIAFSLSLLLSSVSYAADVVNDKSIGMELARDVASATIEACRKDGYHVSAVVVDRHGLMRAALAWSDSGQFRKAREDIRQELNHVDGLIVMEGGIRIVAGGFNLGAVGVSGAPGGDKDAACARKALQELDARIQFAID